MYAIRSYYGSGTVNFTATADNVTAFHFVIQNVTKLAKGGSVSHDFTELGLNTYPVTVIAFGTGGVSTTKTIEVEVLSLYAPPADLLTMLTSDSSRTWRIAAEVGGHFGLGPVGGDPFSWYAAGANEKVDTGRITSYNVCYTKLLRLELSDVSIVNKSAGGA